MTSTKPYLIRAIYEWILDNDMTPHLVVDVSYPGMRVPMEFAEDGRLVLNISPSATRNLLIGNEWIEFNARFGGVARDLLIPADAVIGIFTRENGQGMVFPEPEEPDEELLLEDEQPSTSGPSLRPVASSDGAGDETPPRPTKGKGGPTLKIVK
ncbi:ClpXP protease specificity-enhancing factor [Marichromatium bheemlicum]|uniref:ClpXP protease specificity-enhancing factor n=1 Tax=Marichromatium bheemlicum TaxID=365339 RepID=A0ABX1ICH8_9GAMM|nr:ClpXP protease specificity-enhancing factor [Marichromatium bheemlicum]NKN33885.1 ClpXP protease specificity-enhancing factor [Marichromatium bheemlicum]